MGTETQFRTYQTQARYEEALARHAQWIRWMKSALCPCLSQETNQPNPNCSLCEGRGYTYRTPNKLRVLQEVVKHDSSGKLYPKYTPVTDPVVWRQGSQLTLGSQPADGSYIQLASPYPKSYELVRADYTYNPIITVTGENSEVYGTNTLRTIATRFTDRGKTFEGSVASVTQVYNVTRDETYTVSLFAKEFIYLDSMGTYQAGDTLQVDYSYVKPFRFMLIHISQKMRYERGYVLEGADALLVTPRFVRVAPNDLITALSAEQVASAIVSPQPSGNDVIRNYYDISSLVYVVNVYGVEYEVGVDVELYKRNELKWNVAKPPSQYSVQFTYHPTFAAMPDLQGTRNSEDKTFVNRVNLAQYDRTDAREW